MDKPFISIVANFYKSGKYIPKLLKSVFSQTYTNWELICIDDCSPGNDFKLIQKLTNRWRDSRQVKIIRNSTNLGIAKAKKVGIDNATGEYITFIDGDDWFEYDALKNMVDAALRHNTDLVLMNYYRRYPLGIRKKQSNYTAQFDRSITHEDIIKNYYISFFGINLINVAYWGKLIRTDIIKYSKFKYNDIPIGEDLLFNAHYFPMLKSMVFIDYYGYNWRFGGLTSSNKTIEQVKKIIQDFLELYRIKSQLAKNINYSKAFLPMAIELKNVILSNISSVAKYANDDSRSQRVKDLISEIITTDDFNQNISILLCNKIYSNDLFINAIYEKDITTIYNICHSNYRSNWKKRLIKNFLTLIHK